MRTPVESYLTIKKSDNPAFVSNKSPFVYPTMIIDSAVGSMTTPLTTSS